MKDDDQVNDQGHVLDVVEVVFELFKGVFFTNVNGMVDIIRHLLL